MCTHLKRKKEFALGFYNTEGEIDWEPEKRKHKEAMQPGLWFCSNIYMAA